MKLSQEERKHRLDSLIAEYGIQLDPLDYKHLQRFAWHHEVNDKGYPTLRAWHRGQKRVVRMHRLLMLRKNNYRQWSPKREVMHLDGNWYNLRRDNLALGTHAENHKVRRKRSTPYPNVSVHGRSFVVYLFVDGKTKYFGSFRDVEAAAIHAFELAHVHQKVKPPQLYFDLKREYGNGRAEEATC